MTKWALHKRVVALFTGTMAVACWLAASPVLGQESTETTEEEVVDGTDPGLGSGPTVIDFGDETIVKVEEDWLIDIAVADENSTAPEVVTVFGPSDPYTGLHACFEMNHSTYPDFVRGGMQLQAWFGDWFLAARRHYNGAELLTTIERIQFTCVTRVYEHKTILEVKNGSSITYGNFGDDGSLKLRLWTSRESLNNYNPQTSLTHSRVTFGANRVNRYVRTEVRYYTADGDVIIDEEDHYVHQLVEATEGETPLNP